MIKKGDMVEFTREHYFSYPPADTSKILFGIALENERPDRTVEVETNKGKEVARFIHAYAWHGWVPDELLELYERRWNERSSDNFDYFEEGY